MGESLKVKLTNFRAFSDTGLITVRPLTILVGENSTGKTSFLSAMRFCFGLSDRNKSGYFNSPPFDLGSYADIVHQSGHPSTGLRFSVTIEREININQGGMFNMNPNAKPLDKLCTLEVYFKSQYGEVAVSNFQFRYDDILLTFSSSSNGDLVVSRAGRQLPRPSKQRTFPLNSKKEIFSVDLQSIVYSVYDMYFSWSHQNNKAGRKDAETVGEVARAFDAFVSSSYVIHSSPPVRSVPKRVYTSSDEGGFADQTHAPHELNRLKRSDRSRWSRLNAGLTRFGKLSGLFTRFDITKLTSQDAGPFQLKVTVRGRSSNIADVGYGVSQSLPIMTDLIESTSDRSVFLFQQPEVHLHPRAQAAIGTMFANLISSHPSSFIVTETHSDFLIDRVRMDVRDGKIKPDAVGLLYFEPTDSDVKIHQLAFDALGNITGAPPSYRQFFISEQERVLGL